MWRRSRKAGTQFAETSSADRSAGRLPAGQSTGNQAPPGELRPETYYQANVAFQRDIGFSTTAEIAWVGNFGRNFWRLKDANNIAPYAYADPGESVQQRTDHRQPDTARLSRYRQRSVSADHGRRHAQLQRDAAERAASVLNRGLQMGLAYTLSKSEGIQGYDWADRGAVRRAGPARSVLWTANGDDRAAHQHHGYHPSRPAPHAGPALQLRDSDA